DPSEVAREITLQDALETWGVDALGTDPERLAVIENLERQNKISLPPPLRSFLIREHVEEAIQHHPLGTWLFSLNTLALKKAEPDLDGQYALGVLRREQFHFYAVFNEGDTDARIYILNEEKLSEQKRRTKKNDDPAWRLCAPTVGMFFWDLGQTSL